MNGPLIKSENGGPIFLHDENGFNIFSIFLLPFAFYFNYQIVGITPQQFEQMKKRVGGIARTPTPILHTTRRSEKLVPEIILGVDPSLRGTGYGILLPGKPYPQLLAQGTISCPSTWVRSRCLVKIAEVLREEIKKHRPTVCAIEGIFYAQNLQTALIMGEARGAAMAAIAENGLEIFEIATRKVKQAIVGYGAAQKLAVAKMVQRMLNLEELPAPDAADALALALTFALEKNRIGISAQKKV